MEVYILNGVEMSLAALQAEADSQNMELETFKALYKVTAKTKDVADPDATAASTNTAASLESQLANTKSDWEKWKNENEEKEARGLIGKSKLYQQKRVDFIKKEKDLTNAIKNRNTDPDQLKKLTLNEAALNPDRILLQNEDDIVNWLKETVPFYNPEAGGTAGNSVNIAGKELDLTELFKPSKRQKEKAKQILTELADAKKLKTDNEIIGITATQLGKSVERNPKDLTGVNALLTQNTPYELTEDLLSLESYDEFSQDIKKKYNILKNGEVITTLPASELDDFFKENITNEEFKKISQRSFDAVKTYSALRDAENYQNRIERVYFFNLDRTDEKR